MKMNRAFFMIIFQTLATFGAGINFMLSYFMIKVPNGKQIVADLMEVPNAPFMQVTFMAAICMAGMIVITIGNLSSLKEKERKEDEEN